MRLILYLLLFFIIQTASLLALFEKGGVLIDGAAPSALGGAYVGESDDIYAMFHNPGGLYQSENLSIIAMYGSIVNTKQTSLIFAVSNYFSPYFVLGISAKRFFNSDNSNFEDAYSVALSMPFLRDSEREFGAGVNVKYLYAEFFEKATTVTMDIGFMYKMYGVLMAKSLNIGLVFQDMQSKIRWESGLEEDIPSVYKLGIAYVFSDDLNINFDTEIVSRSSPENDIEIYTRAGVQKNFDFVALRIGAAGFNTVAPAFTAGIGVDANNFNIDYSYLNHTGDLGATHRVDIYFKTDSDSYAPPPTKIEVFSGDTDAYVKWVSALGNPDKYRLYITSDDGDSFIKETNGGEEVNFLIQGLKNRKKYNLRISSIAKGRESEKSEEYYLSPVAMKSEIKLFYKKAKLLYIEKKYDKALKIIDLIMAIDGNNADVIMLKERIRKLMKKI